MFYVSNQTFFNDEESFEKLLRDRDTYVCIADTFLKVLRAQYQCKFSNELEHLRLKFYTDPPRRQRKTSCTPFQTYTRFSP